jgi:hypothetical protein
VLPRPPRPTYAVGAPGGNEPLTLDVPLDCEGLRAISVHPKAYCRKAHGSDGKALRQIDRDWRKVQHIKEGRPGLISGDKHRVGSKHRYKKPYSPYRPRRGIY